MTGQGRDREAGGWVEGGGVEGGGRVQSGCQQRRYEQTDMR